MTTFIETVDFHGHSCPGLAMGFRMVTAALQALEVSSRADDEELVAVVENDACGVDAVQVVAGCSFGKGNLVFHDFGKPVYTIYRRSTGKAARVVFSKENVPSGLREDRKAYQEWVLSVEPEKIMRVDVMDAVAPEKARIHKSFSCTQCGEDVMETRLRTRAGEQVCIPCAEK